MLHSRYLLPDARHFSALLCEKKPVSPSFLYHRGMQYVLSSSTALAIASLFNIIAPLGLTPKWSWCDVSIYITILHHTAFYCKFDKKMTNKPNQYAGSTKHFYKFFHDFNGMPGMGMLVEKSIKKID